MRSHLDFELAAIIEHHLVAELRQLGFPMSRPEFVSYPDGSLCFSADHKSVYALGDRIRGFCREAGLDDPGYHTFRTLAPFTKRFYNIFYPASYRAIYPRYEENGLLFGPGFGQPVSPQEYDLSHMRVFVEFFRKLTNDVVTDLARAVRVWFETIGSRGVFGEKGVSSLSPSLCYEATNAVFEIDASQAGEHTLNTVLLAIASWGIDRSRPLAVVMLMDECDPTVFKRGARVPIN
jgi:hypothetical protein